LAETKIREGVLMRIKILNIVFVSILIVLIAGCAANSTKPNEDKKASEGENVDQLFGISENEKGSTNQPDDEAEVLKLLGISKNEKEGAQTTEQPATEAGSEQNMQGEISTLEQQLLNKEAEISNLKSDIEAKDQRINQLETNVTSRTQHSDKAAINVSGDFLQDYQSALSAYQNKNYKESISMFEELLSRDENNSYMDNCQYWIGESYYGLGNFNQAIVEFTKVFSFSSSNKNDDAQLKLGLCYWKLGDKDKTREELERLISDYPKSEYIEKAESLLAKL
jgi:tol-pal system protein YbgF